MNNPHRAATQLCAEGTAALIIERWALRAVALVGVGVLAGFVAPALHHLLAALTLALTLPGMH